MYKRQLELSHPGDSIVRKLHCLLVQCHRRLEQKTEALAACQAGRAFYPEDAELLSQEGQLRRELGDAVSAEACFLRLLRSREDEHFASVPVGLTALFSCFVIGNALPNRLMNATGSACAMTRPNHRSRNGRAY